MARDRVICKWVVLSDYRFIFIAHRPTLVEDSLSSTTYKVSYNHPYHSPKSKNELQVRQDHLSGCTILWFSRLNTLIPLFSDVVLLEPVD